MAYKTVLTIVGPTGGDRDIKLAAKLSEEIGAHLSVLVVALAAPPPIGDYAAPMPDSWTEEHQADIDRLDQRTAAISALLAPMEISADVTDTYPETPWADEIIGRRARYADIMIVGPDLLSGETLREKTIDGALFSSGRPLLLVPEGAKATLRPKNVMIAWDSRIEASRAMREALDLLVGADEVRLVLVDPIEGESFQGGEPGADAAAYLVRQGVKVTVDRLPSQGKSVAEILKRHAVDMGSDLLVMGAYGHSRLRERIFGGVTRSMLEDVPFPIFMAR